MNNEQGWGIPVTAGFVLTKPVIQMIGLRLALAGTVIKAFLDTQLGFIEDWLLTCANALEANLLAFGLSNLSTS